MIQSKDVLCVNSIVQAKASLQISSDVAGRAVPRTPVDLQSQSL